MFGGLKGENMVKKYLKEIDTFQNGRDIHVQYMSDLEVPIHTHDFFEFVYVIKGQIYNKIDGNEYLLTPGSLLFINYEQTHEIRAKEDYNGEIGYVNVLVTSEFLKPTTENMNNIFDLFSFVALHGLKIKNDNVMPVINFHDKEQFHFENIIYAMLDEYNDMKPNFEKILFHQFYVFILSIIRNLEYKDKDLIMVEVNSKMNKIMEYIEQNYNKDISLNDVAQKFFYNSSYFSRMFKTIIGITFKEYLQDVRVRHAINMIYETDYSFERISEEIGYADKKQFYNVFKKKMGKTPGQYKKEAIKPH